MHNIIKYLRVLLLVSIVSCSYLAVGFDTLESFEKKRNAYETVVTDIRKYRDNLKCSRSICEIELEDINIDKKLQSNFSGIGIVSSKPLVIAFNVTESIYFYIWYAETEDSVEYIFSDPEVVANELTVKKLDEHWFYIKRDWN